MTNSEIIYDALKTNGIPETDLLTMIQTFGELPFHTYADWKRRGRQVKRGEHATIKNLPLWMYTERPTAAQREAAEAAGNNPDELASNPHYYKKACHLFAITQTEVIQQA